MPAGSPFTRLCQATAVKAHLGRADLHLHSTASDGRYTPTQLVDLARRTGLCAIAITDHDTLAGFAEAHRAAHGQVEVIPAVEISCQRQDREVHLLGYYVRPNDTQLNQALDELRRVRLERYQLMVDKLRGLGVDAADAPTTVNGHALGRRHLAHHLADIGAVGTIREALNRYLSDDKPAFAPKQLLDLHHAIDLVNSAGGVASYAHPGNELDAPRLAQLAEAGLGAVEVEYPTFKNSKTTQLRQWAGQLNLAITGGSDCHGPDEPKRAPGASSVSAEELDQLRIRCAQTVP